MVSRNRTTTPYVEPDATYDLRLARLFTRFCLFRRSAASLRPDQSSLEGVITGMRSFWTLPAVDELEVVLALLAM